MKNNLAAMLGVVVLFSVCAWSQSGSVDPSAQPKKASHVIDDDNIGSALARSGDVQNASAGEDSQAEEKKTASAASDSDEKPRSPKQEVERQKAKEKGWVDTIELCKKKIANAPSDNQRDIWTENLAAAEDGLSKTRKELANAEQALEEEEQSHPTQPGAADESGNSSEQTGTGSSPQ